MASENEEHGLTEVLPCKVKIPPMASRFLPAIAVCLMLIFAGYLPAKGQDTCATAVVITHDSTHTLTMLPGIDRIWIAFTPDSSANYLFIEPGMNITGFDTIIVYSGSCGQLNHYLSVGSTDSAVVIYFDNTSQDYFIEIGRFEDSDTGQIIVLNPERGPWPFATSPPVGCNLLSNSDFETLNPFPNNLWYVTNHQNAIGNRPFEFNILTDWRYAWGTPNITPNTNWDPAQNHSVFMWSAYVPPDPVLGIPARYHGEGIFQDFAV